MLLNKQCQNTHG